MTVLDRQEIEAILPHREPFLLIDEVLELEPGERVVARKTVREDEWYLAGHFPGRPVRQDRLDLCALERKRQGHATSRVSSRSRSRLRPRCA